MYRLFHIAFTTRRFLEIKAVSVYQAKDYLVAMASVSIIVVIIGIASMDTAWTQRTDTEVHASLLISPVTIGGLIAFQCRIRNMREEYSVDIARFHDGRIEQITTDRVYHDSSLRNRVFLSTRVFPDRSRVFVVTLVDVSKTDQGEYLCRVQQQSREGSNTIATGRINIQIYIFPREYPVCESVPIQPITLNVGNRLVLTCSSENGVPTAELTWGSTHSNIRIISRNTSTAAMVSSEVTVITDMSFDGALFTCQLTSPGFPNRVRACYIGPITMNRMNNVDIKQPMTPDTGRDLIVKQKTH